MEERDFSPEVIRAEINDEMAVENAAAEKAAELARERQRQNAEFAAQIAHADREKARLEADERRRIVASFMGIFAAEGFEPDPYERLNGVEGREIMPTPEPRRRFLWRPQPAPALRHGWKIRDETTTEIKVGYGQTGYGEALISQEQTNYDYIYIDTAGKVYTQPPISNATLYDHLKAYVKEERRDRATYNGRHGAADPQ